MSDSNSASDSKNITKILERDSAQTPEIRIKLEDNQDAGWSEMSPSCADDVHPDAQFTDSSQSTQQSQEIGDIVVETRKDENPCDARHTVSVRTDHHRLALKRERQRRYRAQHREELNQREAKRRKRQQKLLVQPTTSCSDFDNIEQALDNEHYSENVDIKAALKRERQRRYREQHREELKQRDAERRKRQQNGLFQPTTSCSDFDSIEQAPDNQHSSVSNLEVLPMASADMKAALKKEHQLKYREQHGEELKQCDAERRKRQQNGLFQPTTSCSDFDSIEQAPDNEHSSVSYLEVLPMASADMKAALKKEHQRKYRELHREKLKQREAERRKRRKQARRENSNNDCNDFKQQTTSNTVYIEIVPDSTQTGWQLLKQEPESTDNMQPLLPPSLLPPSLLPPSLLPPPLLPPPLLPLQPAPKLPCQKPRPVKSQPIKQSRPEPNEDTSLTTRMSNQLCIDPTSQQNQSNDPVEDFTNEFDVFGRFVALQLRNLSEEDAVLAQSEIQEVLIRYRLNKIKARYNVPVTNVTSSVIQSEQIDGPSDAASIKEELILKCEPDSE